MSWLNSGFEWVETRLDKGLWFRRGLAVATFALTINLTTWASSFAEKALAKGQVSLLDVAATITAVAGIPLALLTLLFNKYTDSRGSP